jgi:hypothetical protein
MLGSAVLLRGKTGHIEQPPVVLRSSFLGLYEIELVHRFDAQLFVSIPETVKWVVSVGLGVLQGQ